MSYGYSPLRKYDLRMLQASAMIALQANCGLVEALALMTECAQATDETVEQIAELVLAPQVHFNCRREPA